MCGTRWALPVACRTPSEVLHGRIVSKAPTYLSQVLTNSPGGGALLPPMPPTLPTRARTDATIAPDGVSARVRRAAATIAVVIGGVTPSAAAQPAVSLSDATPCVGCAIQLVQAGRLRAPDSAAGYFWDNLFVVVGASGTAVAGPRWPVARGEPILDSFQPNGVPLAAFLPVGGGPQEVESVHAVVAGGGDTIVVFAANKVVVATARGAVVRELQRAPGRVYTATTARSGLITVASAVASQGKVNLMHTIDLATGRVLRSFNTVPAGPFLASEPGWIRILAASPRQTVWAGRLNQYAIEEWAADGRLLRVLARDVDWFRPWDTPTRAARESDERRARVVGARLVGVAEDARGHLWTAVLVPRSTGEAASGGASAFSDPTAADDAFDTILEVVDPGTARVLASRRLPGMYRGLFPGPMLARLVTDVDAVRIDVFRVRFTQP